jgi:hypothetical protein
MGAHPLLTLVQFARGTAALSAGRYTTAFEDLRRVFDPTDIAYHPFVRSWIIADLVEAAVHSGHYDEVRSFVAEMEVHAGKA